MVEGRLLHLDISSDPWSAQENVPKNNFRLDDLLTILASGRPMTSMIQANCSCSFSPGKIGTPVYSSARIQPTDHMSIAMA
jgi:hypothetical protein